MSRDARDSEGIAVNEPEFVNDWPPARQMSFSSMKRPSLFSWRRWAASNYGGTS
jgi:hypothetical protein